MKVVIVDNEVGTGVYAAFTQYANDLGWSVSSIRPSEGSVDECLRLNPDVILADIAWTDDEERELNRIKQTAGTVRDPLAFGGMRLCYEASSLIRFVPVILYTKFDIIELAQHALRLGADQFLIKRTPPESLANAIRTAARNATAYDAPLYDMLTQLFESNRSAWKGVVLQPAVREFYCTKSAERRYGSLCARCIPVLRPMFAKPDTLIAMLAHMIESHAVINVVHTMGRDHVRHAGNVFWIGYLLLNSNGPFQDPAGLQGFRSEAYVSGMPPREQLNLAWCLAALFHDAGYAIQHRRHLGEMLGRTVGLAQPARFAADNGGEVVSSVKVLYKYLRELGTEGQVLMLALKYIVENYSKEVETRTGGKKILEDHGVVSAAILLRELEQGRINEEFSRIILHAAAAMAFHHLAELRREYSAPELDVVIPFGMLPVASLLALCDLIQTWDRELAGIEVGAKTKAVELLEEYGRAFVEQSELIRIDVSGGTKTDVRLDVRYLVSQGERAQEVCADYLGQIESWLASGRAKATAEMFGLSKYFGVSVRYLIAFREPLDSKYF